MDEGKPKNPGNERRQFKQNALFMRVVAEMRGGKNEEKNKWNVDVI